MSRILTPKDGRWYDHLRAVGYYGESELEDWIQQHASAIFPHHFAFPFKKGISSRVTGEVKKPDLALVRKDFSEWTVVEVELETHDVSHVLEQVRVFMDGDFNLYEIAQYARDQMRTFCHKRVAISRLHRLFNGHPPSVLVIADEGTPDLEEQLRKLKVKHCVFETYKRSDGPHVYRVAGEYPRVYECSAHCRPHLQIPNLLEVMGAFEFTRIGRDKTVSVFYQEHLTRWKYIADNGKQYLRFSGKCNPLPMAASESYELSRDKANKYYFRGN